MIKYIGSKRRLATTIADIAMRSGARSAIDLFTGTTRVAQELKRRGIEVTAVDIARYSEVFARCYVQADGSKVEHGEVRGVLDWLASLAPVDGYVTETFCRRSRFFRPENGAVIDSMREGIQRSYRESDLFPILLTSLIEAADRVDSTTGLQMAYLKQWAPRALQPLTLRVPELLAGQGHARRDDARNASSFGRFDFAYLDPPYNQHSYFGNYHIWETLVAWDEPEAYGVACKRSDVRDLENKSPFNRKRLISDALQATIAGVDARTIVVSYNDESWIDIRALAEMLRARTEEVEVLAFDSKRYVGAQIGVHNPSGEKVGTVGRLRNLEYLVVGGTRECVEAVCAPYREGDMRRQASLFT